VFVRNIPGQTGWFASPLVADLDGDGENKLIAAYYTLYVYDAHGRRLDSAVGNGKRIYAPHVVADLEGDGVMEIVASSTNSISESSSGSRPYGQEAVTIDTSGYNRTKEMLCEHLDRFAIR